MDGLYQELVGQGCYNKLSDTARLGRAHKGRERAMANLFAFMAKVRFFTS